MSSSNRVAVAFKKEVTYKTDPGGTFAPMLITADNLDSKHGTIQSQLLVSDRQIPNFVQVDDSSEGSIESELLVDGPHDEFFQGVMCAASAFGAQPTPNTATITVATSGSGNAAITTFTRAAGSWTVNPIPGSWVWFSGFSGGNIVNNGYWLVISSTSTVITCAGTGVAAASVANINMLRGATMIQGTTEQSFYMQRQYQDLSNVNVDFAGCAVDFAEVMLELDAINKVSFGFKGGPVTFNATAKSLSASPNANPTNSIRHVRAVTVGGLRSRGGLQSAKLRIGNALRRNGQIGTLGPIGYRLGSVAAEGTLTAYFSSVLDLQDYIADAATRFGMIVEDPSATYALGFGFPRCKVSGWSATPGQKDTDVVENLTFSAFKDTVGGNTVVLTKFAP